MTVDTRQQLLSQINAQINLNGTGAITGPILNNILDTMVNSSLFNTGGWSQYTSYAPLDIVSYNNASYVATAANVNQIPTNGTYWTLFVSSGATSGAAGSNTQVQYNSGGLLAASSNLTFNGTTLTSNTVSVTNGLTVGGTATIATATVSGTTTTAVLSATTSGTINSLTLTGSSSPSLSLPNIAETTTTSATAATGTVNFDVITQSVLYYTASATGNWTLNIRGNSSTTLNTYMATGCTVTVVFMVTQGATAYYNSAFTIDGTSVTPKWQGGTAPSAGDASSIDVYTYSILKTGSATYTVLATLTKFQ